MNAMKSPVLWATIGGLLGAVAVLFLDGQQVQVADHWASIVGAVGAGVAGAAAAFAAALRNKGPQ